MLETTSAAAVDHVDAELHTAHAGVHVKPAGQVNGRTTVTDTEAEYAVRTVDAAPMLVEATDTAATLERTARPATGWNALGPTAKLISTRGALNDWGVAVN